MIGVAGLLLNTFVKSFSELPYVILLIALLFFLYAVVGMQIFARVAQDSGRAITDQTNFTTLFQAFAVLIRISTGEDWQNIMRDLELSEEKGECLISNGTSPTDECGT